MTNFQRVMNLKDLGSTWKYSNWMQFASKMECFSSTETLFLHDGHVLVYNVMFLPRTQFVNTSNILNNAVIYPPE